MSFELNTSSKVERNTTRSLFFIFLFTMRKERFKQVAHKIMIVCVFSHCHFHSDHLYKIPTEKVKRKNYRNKTTNFERLPTQGKKKIQDLLFGKLKNSVFFQSRLELRGGLSGAVPLRDQCGPELVSFYLKKYYIYINIFKDTLNIFRVFSSSLHLFSCFWINFLKI